MRIFLSLPMAGQTEKEIRDDIEEMKNVIMESGVFDGISIEFVHNLDNDVDPSGCSDLVNEPLLYLGEAIRKMAFCDAIALSRGYNHARGCIVEYEVARQYGLKVYRAYTVEQMRTKYLAN